MLQTRPGLHSPNLPALCPFGHGAYTVRSTRVFASGFLQDPITEKPLPLATVAVPSGHSLQLQGRLTSFGSPPSGWVWTFTEYRVTVHSNHQ